MLQIHVKDKRKFAWDQPQTTDVHNDGRDSSCVVLLVLFTLKPGHFEKGTRKQKTESYSQPSSLICWICWICWIGLDWRLRLVQ